MLNIMTMGYYSLYWFYKNWQQHKLHHETSSWPVMRAIFSVFFTHSLFRAVNERLENNKSSFIWLSEAFATTYVVAVVVARVCERMSAKEIGSPVTDLLALALVPLIGFCMYKAQIAINHACNDIEGESNSKFTAQNIIWMVLGGIFWAIVLLGIYVILNPASFQ